MGLSRLRGVVPGRVGVFAGSLSAQPATVQRQVAAEMEELGYGTLWYGEALGKETFAQAGIFLAATSRLVVASGIANIWARDPVAMAAGGRTIAEAWPQRFMLGLGVSHAPMVEQRGHRYQAPVHAMRRYIEQMYRAAWTGPEAEMPPVVLAALGPRMVALARELAAGAYPYFTTTEHVGSIREQLGPEPFLAADLPVVLAEDQATARAIGDRHTSRYLRTDNYRNNLLRLGWGDEEVQGTGSDALFEAIVAWGDRDQIAERIQAVLEAGADQVVLNLITPDPRLPYLEELRRLAPLVEDLAR